MVMSQGLQKVAGHHQAQRCGGKNPAHWFEKKSGLHATLSLNVEPPDL